MSHDSQAPAAYGVTYLFSVIGALVVLISRPQDRLATYHAKQSLGIAAAAALVFLAWITVGWALAWIPYVGFIVAIALFALVMAALLVLAGCWLAGMVAALREKMRPAPVVGGWALRWFGK